MTDDFDVNRTASSVEPSVRPPWELEPSAKGAVFVVDLDGTLVRSDLLFQGVLTLLGRNPLNIVLILLWLWPKGH